MGIDYRRVAAIAALVCGLAGCAKAEPPSTAAPTGEADREACDALSDARLKLAAAYLEFSGRAEMYEANELEALANDLVDDVNGAIQDLKKAVANTDDAVLKDATTKFVAGLTEQVAAAEAAGTDVEKVMATTKHAGAQAAEKEIIVHCLDI